MPGSTPARRRPGLPKDSSPTCLRPSRKARSHGRRVVGVGQSSGIRHPARSGETTGWRTWPL
jgi:hypothetical protein